MATVWHFTMSLDGYLADADGSLDWLPRDAGPVPMGTELVPTIGAILTGRGTFDTGIVHGGAPYGGAFDGPVLVVSQRPAPPDTAGCVFLGGGLSAPLARAREAAGDGNVVIFGARLGQSCLQDGEVDEVLVHIAPVLLGAGIRAFGPHPRPFTVLERSGPADLTTLRLAPR